MTDNGRPDLSQSYIVTVDIYIIINTIFYFTDISYYHSIIGIDNHINITVLHCAGSTVAYCGTLSAKMVSHGEDRTASETSWKKNTD